MYRFFVEQGQLNQSEITLSSNDYNHIHNVLRMKVGEEVLLCYDGGDKEYQCVITGFDTSLQQVFLAVTDVFGNARELPAMITLFQGYPKGDKMETIVQKAVELGASSVVPVMMKRCVVKLDEKKSKKKVERLQAVALSAAKQAKRGIIPEVSDVMSIAQAVNAAKDYDLVLVPYENANGMQYAKEVIQSASEFKKIAIFIGPEGGFEENEVAMIEAIGGKTISLGHRILRTETAGMTVLSLLMFQLEQDEQGE